MHAGREARGVHVLTSCCMPQQSRIPLLGTLLVLQICTTTAHSLPGRCHTWLFASVLRGIHAHGSLLLCCCVSWNVTGQLSSGRSRAASIHSMLCVLCLCQHRAAPIIAVRAEGCRFVEAINAGFSSLAGAAQCCNHDGQLVQKVSCKCKRRKTGSVRIQVSSCTDVPHQPRPVQT